ncbi:MAG: acetyltransferase [Candidatus Kapabacteria bacterium]|jgi:acetyltransferase EpsM|nr:acetyltransferase [Candidatus Kapabacteria bacterium]
MYLFGASGHGKVVIDIIKSSMKEFEINAVYDDNPKLTSLLNIPVLLINPEVLNNQAYQWLISIGNNKFRKQIAQKIKGSFLKAIHYSAIISDTSEIGEGTVVMANAVINPETKIGKHCIVNSGAIIEHDCIIEDYVHISPNVALAGNVIVEEGTHIGIGACVIQGVKIGKWCTIGAGSVIIKDIPDGATVVGNPGRIIK